MSVTLFLQRHAGVINLTVAQPAAGCPDGHDPHPVSAEACGFAAPDLGERARLDFFSVVLSADADRRRRCRRMRRSWRRRRMRIENLPLKGQPISLGMQNYEAERERVAFCFLGVSYGEWGIVCVDTTLKVIEVFPVEVPPCLPSACAVTGTPGARFRSCSVIAPPGAFNVI